MVDRTGTVDALVAYLTSRYRDRVWGPDGLQDDSGEWIVEPYVPLTPAMLAVEGDPCLPGVVESRLWATLFLDFDARPDAIYHEITDPGAFMILSGEDVTAYCRYLQAVGQIGNSVLVRGRSVGSPIVKPLLNHPLLDEGLRLDLLDYCQQQLLADLTNASTGIGWRNIVEATIYDPLRTDAYLARLIDHGLFAEEAYAHPNAGPLVAQAWVRAAAGTDEVQRNIYLDGILALIANPHLPETDVPSLVTMVEAVTPTQVAEDLENAPWPVDFGPFLSEEFFRAHLMTDKARSALLLASL